MGFIFGGKRYGTHRDIAFETRSESFKIHVNHTYYPHWEKAENPWERDQHIELEYADLPGLVRVLKHIATDWGIDLGVWRPIDYVAEIDELQNELWQDAQNEKDLEKRKRLVGIWTRVYDAFAFIKEETTAMTREAALKRAQSIAWLLQSPAWIMREKTESDEPESFWAEPIANWQHVTAEMQARGCALVYPDGREVEANPDSLTDAFGAYVRAQPNQEDALDVIIRDAGRFTPESEV